MGEGLERFLRPVLGLFIGAARGVRPMMDLFLGLLMDALGAVAVVADGFPRMLHRLVAVSIVMDAGAVVIMMHAVVRIAEGILYAVRHVIHAIRNGILDKLAVLLPLIANGASEDEIYAK